MFDVAQLVKLGWNEYAKVTKAERNISPEYSVLKMFSDMLPKNSDVLDIGCGSGRPITQYLSDEGHRLLRIDISPGQIGKARLQLVKSNVAIADMMNYKYPDDHYHGLVCLHSLVHVERIYHSKLLKIFYRALKPGGLILISINTDSKEGISYLNSDIPMFYSHFDEFESIKNITSANFSIIYKTAVYVHKYKYIYVIAKKEGLLTKDVERIIIYSSKD